MEFSVIYIILVIILILVVFSIVYDHILIKRYNKNKTKILDKKYLDSLFEECDNPLEASKDRNGDICIDSVDFMEYNFSFTKEIQALNVETEEQ